MCLLRSAVVCGIFFALTLAKNDTKESIGFPETEEDTSLTNKDNRQPVYIPARCPVNELYYPGDQADDWICDCRPAYLYHPATDACWPAYRQGPCQVGKYLVLRTDSAIPVCEDNPCGKDNQVQYNGTCEYLTSYTPCRHMYPIPAALAVNASSLTVTCERLNLQSRFGEREEIRVTTVKCPPGCKRSINGKCVASNS